MPANAGVGVDGRDDPRVQQAAPVEVAGIACRTVTFARPSVLGRRRPIWLVVRLRHPGSSGDVTISRRPGPTPRRRVAARLPSASESRASLGTLATRPAVRARSVAVRVPSTRAARSPTTAPGPDLGDLARRRPRPRTSRRGRGRPPCRARPARQVSPSAIVRIFGFAPPRMIALESDRSSADSTAATTAGESCSPHGVRSPNELLNHFPKSMTPDFWMSLPSWS